MALVVVPTSSATARTDRAARPRAETKRSAASSNAARVAASCFFRRPISTIYRDGVTLRCNETRDPMTAVSSATGTEDQAPSIGTSAPQPPQADGAARAAGGPPTAAQRLGELMH